ncbi:DNA polymerase delta small subunit [Phytophthora nicotianae]|uniref:DNA polymerase delta small subunit n=1 Tax=Phytophthora nicotianae TaxID=4792 RepID=A0A0W8CZ11_PHYNI|nr:DNA polymerase delta small subunit [Phytophthora nicotianae]
MPGLAASDLPPETLHPGDTLEYFSNAFVFGDPRGRRVAVVTKVDARKGVDYPVTLDTGDVISLTMMTKRLADRFGRLLKPDTTKWRKLRTYELAAGSCSAPSRAISLKKALEDAVKASIEAVYRALRDVPDEIVQESPQSDDFDSEDPASRPADPSSTPNIQATALPNPSEDSELLEDKAKIEEKTPSSCINQVIDLVSSEEEETMPRNDKMDAAPSDEKVKEAAAYLSTIPSRYAREKIRHQPKKRNGQWHVPRSRKRRDLMKCAITSSGNAIYHAKTVKAVKIQTLLSSPEVKSRLKNLHARRTTYPDPTTRNERVLLTEFPGLPASRRSVVANATDGRVGLGVYTTTDLDVGDVVGEYCGELSEFPTVVHGQPDQAVKQNSGYTLLYNAKSTKKNYVYVDALKCGSITRFISHACDPNAAFVEQQTRTRVKVLVKMIKDVKAGAQITVHYGNERWFKCACDDCWAENDNEAANSGTE